MITLHRIRLENFMNIDQLDMSLDEGEFVVIAGDNGSGKSALMAAIALTFVGYRRGDSYKDFIQRGQTQALVSVDATISGKPVQSNITITSKKYSTPLSRTVHYEGEEYHNSEVPELFRQLGIDAIDQIMFLFQREASIVDLRPGERAALLKQLFHFEFTEQIETLKQQYETNAEEHTQVSAVYENVKNQTVDIIPLDPVMDQDEITNLETELASLDSQLDEAGPVPDMRELRLSLQESENNYNRLRQLYTVAVTERDAKVRERDTRQAEFDRVTSHRSIDLTVLENVVESLREKHTAAREQIIQNRATQNTAQTSLKDAIKHVQVHEQGTCYVCGQDIPESILETTRKEVSVAEQALAAAEQALISASTTAAGLEEELTTKQAHLQKARTTAATIASLRATIEQLDQSIEHYNNTIPEYERSFKHSEQTYNATKTAYDELIAKYSSTQSEIDQKKARRNTIANTLKQQEVTVVRNQERQTMNAAAEKRQAELDEQKASLLSQIAGLQTSMSTIKEALRIFEKDLPNFVILRTCSHLESIINSIVQRVFPTMKVKLIQNKRGVEFFYTTGTEEWSSAKMASGAQSAVLTLAWRIAIARLYGVTTIMLDEVDADATDDNSRLISEFIASLTMFNQIMLISHRKESVKTIATLADNVSCYYVTDGEYEKVPVDELVE